MNPLFEPTLSLSQFRLPPQDINLLSFCESNKASRLKEWVDTLKITQVDKATVTLYTALPEVLHLKTDASARYAMLEVFWPVVQRCLQVFSKEFLQQPLILPPKAQKSAIISQALQKHLLDGYTLCANELVHQQRLKPNKKDLLHNCLYRAMTALGLFMLRSYQLYTPIPAKLWLRAHALFQTAEFYELHNIPVPVAQQSNAAGKTLLEAYIQIIAMGCIRPNQLSQNDISNTYRSLNNWSKHISLSPGATEDDRNLFLINQSHDIGPQAKVRFNGATSDQVFELNFQSLVSKISGASEIEDTMESQSNLKTINILPEVSATLIEHIIDSWSHSAERDQKRKRIRIDAEACVGIIDCHYHISGKVEFNQFINPNDTRMDDSFLSAGFGQMITDLSAAKMSSKPKQSKQSIFQISIQNISSGGYCLQWQDDLPSRIEAGELMGIREKGRRAWSIGVIRWVRQARKMTQLGVQVLCNQPVPYGASVTLPNGIESDYMRVIHIPAPMMDGQPPSLLTTTIPFQENRRAELKQDDNITSVRLGKSVFSTSKLRLFDFDTIAQSDHDSNDL